METIESKLNLEDELLNEINRLNKALRIAVGMLSTTKKYKRRHPEEILDEIIKITEEDL